MSVSWSNVFATRTSRMKASDIRELLKLTARPEIISLAGGLPAPELFPIDEYRRAFLFEGVSWRNQYVRVVHGELSRDQTRSDDAWATWKSGARIALRDPN